GPGCRCEVSRFDGRDAANYGEGTAANTLKKQPRLTGTGAIYVRSIHTGHRRRIPDRGSADARAAFARLSIPRGREDDSRGADQARDDSINDGGRHGHLPAHSGSAEGYYSVAQHYLQIGGQNRPDDCRRLDASDFALAGPEDF